MRKYRRYDYNGLSFRSGLELAVAKLLTEQGIEFAYETMRIPYWLKARGGMCRDCSSRHVVIKHDYTPDFYLPDTETIIEVKGLFSAKDRKKHKAIKEQLPEHNICMWFGSDRTLHPNTDTRYSKWCSDVGLPYHVGVSEVPEWLWKKTT